MPIPFTAGPWSNAPDRPHVVLADGLSIIIAVCHSGLPEGVANARLAAHAPAMHDLLCACYARAAADLDSLGTPAPGDRDHEDAVSEAGAWAERLRRQIALALGAES